MIKIVINPDFYEMVDGDYVGWSATSPFKKLCPDYRKFVICIGKSADVAIKTNYNISSDELFGGSRAIVVNHIGAELHDSMFHSLVNNPNQYDYIVQVMDLMSRGHIKVYRDGVVMTITDVANFDI